MNRICLALLVLVALELAAAAFWLGQRRESSTAPPPQPDLGILDAASAAEIVKRQELARSENRAEHWTDLAAIYVVYGYFADADVCCRRSIELEADSFWTNFWWGAALNRLGRLPESSDRFQAAMEHAEPRQVGFCWYCIGLNRLREEKTNEAEQAFRSGTGFPPADYELAKLLVRSERVELAIPLLEKLTQDHPRAERYWQLRARAAEALAENVAAEDFRERADRSPELHSSDELTGFLEQQIEKYGLDRRIAEGHRLLRSGDPAGAADMLQGALALEWRPAAADLLVEAELALGRPDEALRFLDGAIGRFSATPGRIVAQGDAWRMKGDVKEAIRSWERAARMRLDRAAHTRLADHYSQTGDAALADRHRALAIHAEGLAAFRTDDLATAMRLFEEATQLAPRQAESWHYLGECRRFLGKPTLAIESYHRCLELAPHHGRARRSLARLTPSSQ